MSARVMRRYSYWLLPLIAGALKAEQAFRQLRSSEGLLDREAANETGERVPLAASGGGDDSPTLKLPSGMILDSRITDEADALEKEHSAS